MVIESIFNPLTFLEEYADKFHVDLEEYADKFRGVICRRLRLIGL